jgi:hypothetical protein
MSNLGHLTVILFRILEVTEEGVGSFSQRYGSTDQDQHQHVTDPQH